MDAVSKRLQNFITGRRNEVADLPPLEIDGARDFLTANEYKALATLTRKLSRSSCHQLFESHMWNTVQRPETIQNSVVSCNNKC
jgi:hypothetical protein